MGWLMQFSSPSHHEETAELTWAAGDCQPFPVEKQPRLESGQPLSQGFPALSLPHWRPLPAPRCDSTGTMAGGHSKRQQGGSAWLWGTILAEPEQETSPFQNNAANCSYTRQTAWRYRNWVLQLEPAPPGSRTQEALTEGTTTTAPALQKRTLSSSQEPAILHCITVSIALTFTSGRRGSSVTGTSRAVLSAVCASTCTQPAKSPRNYRNAQNQQIFSPNFPNFKFLPHSSPCHHTCSGTQF